jgi:NADH dehydrogenase FAD-containing subunit
LNNEENVISSNTIVWAGGARPDVLISNLQCKHDSNGRMITNNYLEVQGHEDSVFALGDCASAALHTYSTKEIKGDDRLVHRSILQA